MRRRKIEDDEAVCYVCHKKRKKTEMLDLTNGIYRCKEHRWEKVLKASRENLIARNKESI